jgi:pyrroloquinoline quinone (PQQ) biosynthesis protein C
VSFFKCYQCYKITSKRLVKHVTKYYFYQMNVRITLSKIVVSCENYQKYLIMMFNILSFFNVRNVKNYINSNNNNKLENKYISD